MAIPSGSGTEVLKRFIKDGQDNTESKAIDGVADHIYTVLSIIVKNQAGSTKEFYIKIAPSAGTQIMILSTSIASGDTFVWNDKFVLSSGDALAFRSDENSSADDFDIYISFIDQDWS